MKTSEHGLELLAQWEGEVDHVYRDQAGLQTIGIGHLLTRSELMSGTININGASVTISGGLTHQQALDLCAQDVGPAEAMVNTAVTAELTQNQFDTLVIFTFNIGTGGFHSSSALQAINSGNMASVPDDLMKWDKITVNGQHVVSQGLVDRRQHEIDLWNGSA